MENIYTQKKKGVKMKTTKELIEEGILDINKIIIRNFIASFYKQQLKKFDRIGVGKKTDNGVIITD